MNYGLPYQGSKAAIADKLIRQLPINDNFYDIFAGGCAMTHAAMRADKWEHFFANDITDAPKLFQRAVQGELKDETRWISRDTFFAEKDHDPYIRMCWSFGNNQRDYLYSQTIEPYKRAVHYAVVHNQWDEISALCPEVTPACKKALNGIADTKERRVTFGRTVVNELKRIGDMQLIENNPLYKSCHWKDGKNARRLERLECLERLERLQSLESLQNIQITQLSYDEVDIKPNSTVYADPPYINTGGYLNEFSHEDFYQWLRTRDFAVYVSEYQMPEDFTCIYAAKKLCSLSQTATNRAIEKLFVHNRWIKSVQQTELFAYNDFI